MLRRVKKLIRENRQYHQDNYLLLQELNWADVFHDSIRGFDWLEKLPLNIGRWAGGYNFFYVLVRILNDYRPSRILELGLGESSKLISVFAENNPETELHTIIEEDIEWKLNFEKNHRLSKSSIIEICPAKEIIVNGFETKVFSGIKEKLELPYDFYVIDGPKGSERYSRYDIVDIAGNFKSNEEFVILFDDAQRTGEKDTIAELIELFNKKGIPIKVGAFIGLKKVMVLATEKYRHVITI